MKNTKVKFILFSILFFIGLNATSHFFYRFILIGIITIPFTYYLLKINPFKKLGYILIFFFGILVLPVVLYSLMKGGRIPGIVFCSIYLIASVFAIAIYNSHYKKMFSGIYILVFTILVWNHDNMMNYYYDNINSQGVKNTTLPKLVIEDKNGIKSEIKANGKIQVIDLWSNSCGNCIKAFPKFQRLFEYYKNDKDVEVYAVNVRDRGFDKTEAESYVKKYTFKNYYTDINIKKKLTFNAYPYYMIINKEGDIKYFGSLNIDISNTYNNIYDLIENER